MVRGEVDCCLTPPRRYFSSSCRFASEMFGKVTSVVIAEECSCKVYRLTSTPVEIRLLFPATAGVPPAPSYLSANSRYLRPPFAGGRDARGPRKALATKLTCSMKWAAGRTRH